MVDRKTQIDFRLEKAFVYEFTIEELRECLNAIEDELGDNMNGAQIDAYFNQNANLLPQKYPERFDIFKRDKVLEVL